MTAYSAFLRYNELASLRCCDVSFRDTFVRIYVFKSKTDVYRDGANVLLAKTDSVSCPFHMLYRYVCAANLDLSSSLPFFRSLHFHKATSTYSLRSTGMSYTRTREIVLQAFAELGYPKHLFGLHSLRAGVLLQPLTQALAIVFLNVTADGRQIEPRTAILRIN